MNGSRMDFAQMLEESINKKDNFNPGDAVSGTIIQINQETVFVDINGKSEGVLEKHELLVNGELSVKKGDVIEVYVVGREAGEIRLTTAIGKGEVNFDLLRLAYQNKIPVFAKVLSLQNGGFKISIGGVQAFCPVSQLDLRPIKDNDQFIGKSFQFQITKLVEKEKNVVVSRRILLESEASEQKEFLKTELKVGQTITGEVSSLQDFGVFVRFSGIEGLIPKSELSWGRNSSSKDFTVGSKITCKITNLDWENNKIALSLKQLLANPQDNIVNYQVNAEYTGKVVNLIKNGAFVQLEPGLEGFIPVNRLSKTKRINKPEEVLSIGDNVRVRIDSVNLADKKISLDLLTDEVDPWLNSSEKELNGIISATVEATNINGVTVRLDNGMQGYIHGMELLAAKGSDLAKLYPAGKSLRLTVKEFDVDRRRLQLSEKGVGNLEESEAYKNFQDNQNSTMSGISLGSMLKDKFADLQNKVNK